MNWFQAYADPEWRIWHRLWSVRLALLWGAVSGFYMFLPALQGIIPMWLFGLLCIGFSIAIAIARITKQPGLPDV